MRTFCFKWLAYSVLITWAFSSQAQEGPFVPCPNCEARIFQPYPDSGPWANTDQTGSGLLLHVQNGILAGFHFGYDSEGHPEWLLFNGELESNQEDGDILWQLEAPLSRFSGGSCSTCPYQPPSLQESVGTIRLKFFQRNHASVQIDSEDEQFMVPLLYGSAGNARFAEFTPYLLPELGSDDEADARYWVISILDGTDQTSVSQHWHVRFLASEVTVDAEDGLQVKYRTIESPAIVTPAVPAVRVTCSVFSGETEPRCVALVALPRFGDVFYMPLANLSANRFFAESEDGLRLEAFRLNYD
jgi:hypothetical protein